MTRATGSGKKPTDHRLDYLAELLSNISDAVFTLDSNLRLTSLNAAAEGVYGWKEKEVLGKDISALIGSKPDPERRKTLLQELLEKFSIRLESEHLSRSGQRLFLESEFILFRNTQGQPSGYLVINRDLTAHRRTEEALRKSEEKYRKLVRHVPAAIYEMDLEGTRFLTVNRAMCEILGYDREELLATRPADLLDEESRRVFRERIGQLIGGEAIKEAVEYRVRKKDGTWLDVMVSVGPVADEEPQPSRVAVVAYDITERKRIENALRQSQERYRELVESSNSIIMRMDANLNITYMNEFGLKFFGYGAEELIGRNVVGTTIPEKDEEGRDLRAMAQEIARHPEDFQTNVHQNVKKNGGLVWVSWTNKPTYDREGRLVDILAIGNDLSQLKKAEEDLREAKRQAELYLDLMAHDISNLHQVALGQLEVALEIMNEEGELMTKDRDLIETPLETLNRSARLIENVRNLQRLRSGEFKEEIMDLSGLLSELVASYHRAGPGYRVDFRNPGPRLIKANKLLQDVFANLIGNALVHSNAKKVEVTVGLETVLQNGQKFHRVRVEDNGPGIPEGMKDKVFDRLERGATKARGLGLGLYLVRSLAESYGGKVWVEDRIEGDPSRGSRFVVLLPAVRGPHAG